jgi:hypothetical protein
MADTFQYTKSQEYNWELDGAQYQIMPQVNKCRLKVTKLTQHRILNTSWFLMSPFE